MNVWAHTAHFPVIGDERWHNASSADTGLGNYLAEVAALDANVGRLVAAIDEKPAAATRALSGTLIVFSSDHGPDLARVAGPELKSIHRVGNMRGSTDGRRGAKGSLFEGGVRVPLIARGWGVRPGADLGPRRLGVFSGWDWLPTISEIARLPPGGAPMAQGEARPCALLGEPCAPRATPLVWVRSKGGSGSSGGDWAVRDGRYKLHGRDYDYARGVRLYDIDADPNEAHDLLVGHPDVGTRLAKIAHERTRGSWVADANAAARMERGDQHVSRAVQGGVPLLGYGDSKVVEIFDLRRRLNRHVAPSSKKWHDVGELYDIRETPIRRKTRDVIDALTVEKANTMTRG